MRPHRCIDGGAGVDGCPRREWFEVLGRDPTWRLAVRADVGRSFGLTAAITRDACSPRRDSPHSRVASPLALPTSLPFVMSDLLEERKYDDGA